MGNDHKLISDSFRAFNEDAAEYAHLWRTMVQGLSAVSALDKKTHALAYLSVLSVLRRSNGIPFHVQSAKAAGASREEVISAILVGLPAAGHVVTEVLPCALTAYDEG